MEKSSDEKRRGSGQVHGVVGLPVSERGNVTDAERLRSISLFLAVARGTLDGLMRYDYVQECAALDTLNMNLDAAISICNGE